MTETQAPSPPGKKPAGAKVSFRSLLTKRDLLIVFLFFALIFGYLAYLFFYPNYYPGSAPILFEIRKGESLAEISDSLYKKKIIGNKTLFRISSFIYGAEKNIQAGRYTIPNGLGYLSLVELLVSGKCEFPVPLFLYGGISLERIRQKLAAAKLPAAGTFLEAAVDKYLLAKCKLDAVSFEGYLLPGNYEFYPDDSPYTIIQKTHFAFREFFVDSLSRRAVKLGYTVHEIITLASIIAGETTSKEEMPRISGVYYNRLKKRMKLQADPTVQYALGGEWKRLTRSDLAFDSPYNTYKYSGLPPGPIGSPGKNAILSALYPEKHNYLYFVADSNGVHQFSETYQEHLRKAKEYHIWLNTLDE